MSIHYNNSPIAASGLVLLLDAGNPKSYPGTGTSVFKTEQINYQYGQHKMKKELVAIKNREHWDIIFDVSLSEGKNLSSELDTIDIIKNNFVELTKADFMVEGIEMFAIVKNMSTVNPGNGCKV